MRRLSGDQLGPVVVARVAGKLAATFPAVARTTISDLPLVWRTAAIRDPSGDQRGSAHCTSGLGGVRDLSVRGSAVSVTSVVVAGWSCTATISPSLLASGAVSRAPTVSRFSVPAFSR